MPTMLEEPVQPVALLAGGDEETYYEIINGQRVELPPMSVYSTWLACRLLAEWSIFLSTRELGRPVLEVLFRLPLQGRNRRPDAAFVSFDRWAKDRPVPGKDNAWDVVPDLAVEVVSPTDLAEELMQKVTEYFLSGVRLVWIVYPEQRLVYVYESLTQVRELSLTDHLDGGTVLPGFSLPLAKLFADAPPQR